MMIINKKYIAMTLLVVAFGHVAAMKRNFQLGCPEANSVTKRQKTSAAAPVEHKLPLAYYIKGQDKLEESLARVDSGSREENLKKIKYRAQKLCALKNHPFGVVATLVSSELSADEKRKIFDGLTIIEDGQSQEEIFNMLGNTDLSPLRLAVMYDDYQVVHHLLSRGANQNDRDSYGRPVSFDAQDVETLQLLRSFRPLEATDNPLVKVDTFCHQTDNAGRTLLFENATADSKDIEIATWFITQGGRLERKNNLGETAYQEQLLRGYVNPYLATEEYASVMVRKSLGINNPNFLHGIQAGKFRIKMS